MQSWENGLYICDDCKGEFEQDELELVDGGVESVGATPEDEGRYIRVSASVCPDCLKKRTDAVARFLLSW